MSASARAARSIAACVIRLGVLPEVVILFSIRRPPGRNDSYTASSLGEDYGKRTIMLSHTDQNVALFAVISAVVQRSTANGSLKTAFANSKVIPWRRRLERALAASQRKFQIPEYYGKPAVQRMRDAGSRLARIATKLQAGSEAWSAAINSCCTDLLTASSGIPAGLAD